MTPDPASSENRDELDPEVNRVVLPDKIKMARENRDVQTASEKAKYEPRILEHIKLHRAAISWLDEVHEWIVDTYDFDIDGDNRPAAVWKMSGRILGICHLIIDSLEMGYTAEITSLGRDVHEANRLLEMFLMPNEKELLKRWLADQHIKASTIRKAERRFQREIEKQMKNQGIDAAFPSMESISGQVHGELSGAAHHRRKWVDDNVISEERRMIKGKTDVWIRRAATTESLLAIVEESVIIVGDAFAQFNEPGWYKSQVGKFLEAFAGLRRLKPLT